MRVKHYVYSSLLAILALATIQRTALAQCGTMPTITGLASFKTTPTLCSPVSVSMQYTVQFASNIPVGSTLDLYYFWGDGTTTVVGLTPGTNSYNVTRNKSYGVNSDCEYQVTMQLRFNGTFCTQGQQIQKVPSWRTEAFNLGNVNLVSSTQGTNVHQVCEGVPISVVFNDITNFNCNANYDPNPPVAAVPVETPNIEVRWQQIVYNTPIPGTKIPNVSVNGVPVTGAGGADVIANYQDPRGVFQMLPPVVVNDPRRRPTLTITAPGGFGAGFPQVGQEFEITIRYWNYCNPYDDPNIPGLPVNLINGDNPPVEQTALIRIIDSPDAPVVPDRDICSGTSTTLTVSSPLGAGFTYRWWSDQALTTQVGTGTTFTPTNLQAPVGQRTHFWVTVESTAAGTCRSAATEVRLIRRAALTAPSPISGPLNLCPNSTYTYSVGSSPTDIVITDATSDPDVNLPTQYIWTVPSGWTINSGNGTNTINVTTGAAAAGNVTVTRQYTSAPNCAATATSQAVTVRAQPTANITPNPATLCAGGTIQLNGNPSLPASGGGFNPTISSHTWSGSTGILDADNVQQPNVLTSATAGAYPLTYVVTADYGSGVFCSSAPVNRTVNISANPGTATVGANQNLCFVAGPLTSNPLGGNTPAAGTGTWTKVSGPGTVTFNPSANTPNATATVSLNGVYVLRWTISNPPCTSQADITVDYGTDPGPQNAGTDAAFCGLTGSLPGAGAVTPTVGSITWSQVAGPVGGTTVFGTPNAFNTTTSANVLGTYTYRMTVTSGTCASRTDDILVTYNNPATVQNVADFTTCVDGTLLAPIALSGTFGGGASNAHWERVTGTGTFTSNGTSVGANDASSPATDSYTPTAADFSSGSVQVRLVSDDPAGPCLSVLDNVTITFDRRPATADGGSNFSVCGSTAALTAVAATNGGTGTWTGPVGVTFTPSANSPTATANNLAVGANNLTWTVTSALGVCGSTNEVIVVTRNAVPVNNNQTQQRCVDVPGGSTAVVALTELQALNDAITGIVGSTNRTVTFYEDAARTDLYDATETLSNGAIAYTRVTRTDVSPACTTDGTVTFTINARPGVTAQNPEFCEDLPVGSNTKAGINLTSFNNAIKNGVAANTVAWFTNAARTIPVATPTSVTANNNTRFYARVTNPTTTCTDTTSLKIKLNPIPSPNPIIGANEVCADPTTAILYQLLTSKPGYTYSWSIPEPPFDIRLGGASTDDLVLLSFPVVVDPAQNISVVETSDKGCVGSANVFAIRVNSSPPTINISGPSAVCENEAGVVFSVPALANTTYAWTVPTGASIISGQGTNSITVNFGIIGGLVSVTPSTQTTTGGCAGNLDDHSVAINPRPTLNAISNTVCSDAVAGITLAGTGATSFDITNVAIPAGITPSSRALANGVAANAIFNDVFTNTTGGSLVVQYTIVPVSALGCKGASRVVNLTVQPEPVLDPGLVDEICSSTEDVNIVLKVAVGSFPADQYDITAVNVPAGVTPVAGNPTTTGNGFTATVLTDDRWQNLTAGPLVVQYMVRPRNTSTGCLGDPAIPVRVTVNPEPQVAAASQTICSGDSPSLTLTTSPLIAGSTFAWTVKSVTGLITGTANGTGATITNVLINNGVAAGTVTYEVRATGPAGVGGCLGPPTDVTITVNPAPLTNNVDQVVCSTSPGGNTYTENLIALQPAINADGTLTFSWHTSQADALANINAMTVGTASAFPLAHFIPVFVRVSNGTCARIQQVRYEVNPSPSVTASAPQFNGFEITCNGSANGQINAIATPNTGIVFSIDGGFNYFPSGAFNALAPGAYTVRIKDQKGCEANSSPVTITQPTVVVASAGTVVNVACKGTNTGSIQVVGAGGVGGYTYSLNGGAFQASDSFTGLTAASYTIAVRDANGCVDSEVVTITEPTLLTASIASQTNVNCNGNSNGSVEVTGAGGVGPYMYSLNSGAFQNAPGIFTGLAAGTYTVTVRDANLCTTNVLVTITQPAILSLTLNSKTDVACNGNSTGSITVTGSGGTLPYQYDIGSGFQASGTFSGLSASTYTITVRDAQNCTTSINVTINQPSLLQGNITSQTNVNCFGNATGSVTVNGTGGTGSYLFALDAGAFGGSGTFSGLTAGSYTITIRDANMCTTTVPVVIIQPTALGGSIVNLTDALCNGSSSGTVEVSGLNGTAPYQYSINGGGLFVSSGMFTGLAAGTYTVIVRDNNQCTFNVPVTINQPTALTASINSQTNVDCNGNNTGSVTLTASGGTGAYSYNIGGGFQASSTFNGLAAGTYNVVVRDANMCIVNVPVTLTQPSVLTISLSAKVDPSCNSGTNGSITVAGNGGTGPYEFNRGIGFQPSGTFSGLAAGTYTITIRDARGCTATLPNIILNQPTVLTGIITGQTNVACFGGNTGSVTINGQGGTGTYTYSIGGGFQTSGTFSGLTAGNYVVTINDQNLCPATIPVTITEPTQLGGSVSTITDALCKGSSSGTVIIAGSGGVAPYQYSINGVLFLSSGSFINLAAGNYTVRVRDNNQCTFDVNFTINEPTQVSVSVSAQTNVDCKGSATGSVTAAGAGGVGGYTYSIDNGAFQLSPTFTGLTAGNHTVKVRDANFCEASTIAIISEPTLLIVNIASQLNVDCNGNATGSVTLNGTGGTGAYQFSVVPFGNAPGVFGVGATFGSLAAGLYTAYIRDANLCISSITVTITEPAVLGLGIVTQVNVVCNGQNTGSVVVQATGGTQPYQYSIDAGSLSASNTFTGLAQGSYIVHVRDFNGCTQSIPVTITENAAVTGTLAVTSNGGALYNGFGVSCFNSSNGQITVQGVTGGTGGYTFQLVQDLSNTPIGNVFNNVRANPAYTVIIRDNSGCSVTVGPIAVTQPNQLTIDISKAASYNGFDVSCVNATDGAIRVDASTGGSGNNTYTLIKDGVDFAGPASGALPLTFSTLATSTAIGKGVYMVRVQDSNTCSVTSTPQIIVDPPDLFAGFLAPQPAKCFNSDPAPIVQLSAPVGGIGSATYTYRWFESTDDVTYTEIIGETGVSYDPPTTITQVSQDTPYQYYYKRETTSGCNVKISAAVSITVNPLPRVTVSTLNPPPAFVCEDQPLIFEYDFAPGQAPFYLSYTAITRNPAGVIIQTDMITDRLSGSSTPIVIPQFKDDMEFIVTKIKDFNKCEGTVFPPNVIVEVGKADASFAVVGPNPQCSGSEFTFQWDADPDVAYTWTWPDGASTPQPAAGLDGVNTINKIIAVPNTATQTKLPVVLSAQNTTYPTCPADLHIEYVNIHPEITPGWVIPSDTVCSGTPINITNLTLSSAGSVHTWTVKRLSDGFIETALGRSGAFKSMEEFIITNDNHNAGMTIPPDVPKNPERYEITYKIENTPGNGSCSKFIRDTVTVYRGAVAKIGAPKDPLQTTFTWGDNLGPNNGMLINFENHSDPLDGGDFEYTWVFSNNNANTPPETFVSSAASVPYEFMNPGINKKAILTVVNTDARDIAHLPNGCATTDEFTFEIDVPPLVAAFTIDAVESCVPVTLSVTNNSTPLMFNKWTIVNETVGGIPRESNDFKPNFPVQEPGRYRITLKVRNPSFPDQEAYYVSAVDQTVDLYENPIASFTTAPDQRIFIPDQELRTDNRSETAYDEISDSYLDIYYHWYFGDGSDTIKSVVNPNSLDPLSGHSPTHRYETEGLDTIRLVAINFHGTYACRDTATRIIRAVAAGTSKVPNAFTPNPGGPSGGVVNEDGTTINDVFLPITKGVKEFQMQIFDRWGNLVFQSTQQNKGWDGYDRNGNLMPAGVYVYKLVLRMANDQRTTQVGDVTLIR